MGSLLNRSSGHDDRKVRKEKRKRRHDKSDHSFHSDAYLIHDGKENEHLNGHFMTTYELWNKEYNKQQMMNMNDPPGAPSTYPPTYSMGRNDMHTQSWPSSHDVNNSFYSTNSLQMTSPYNIPYIPDQYNHTRIPNTINNQSKTVVLEERPSKKVQFSSSQPQQQTPVLKPLVSTHSWHESNDIVKPTTIKPVPLSNRSSLPRSTTAIPKISPAPVEKPIYVGIDHKATLAERGERVANKRPHKNIEKNPSDKLNSPSDNQRTRSHASRQHKHRTLTDSPNKSFDSLQPNSHRTITKSFSVNKLSENIEQRPFITNENKPIKSRNHHREQSLNNEIKPSKNHRRHHQEYLLNESPLITQSLPRRTENKQSNTPMMRIPLAQFNHQHQKKPIILSGTTSITSITQTRM